MHLAYIISAYKLPQQLVRLVKRLNSPGATFFIHVDQKSSDETFNQMRQGLARLANVHFLERHVCHRCYFGHVEATLKGIKEIYRRHLAFDFAILLTGQDYPIKSNAFIKDFFIRHIGISFMQHFALPTEYWSGGGLDRVEYWHYRCFGKDLRFPSSLKGGRFSLPRKLVDVFLPKKRSFPKGLQPFGGSGYWCLSQEAVRYIYDYVNDHPEVVRFFRSVFIPDEIFFHTILLSSPLADSIVNDDLRHIDWSSERPGPKPAVLCNDDLEDLQASPKLYARKFDITGGAGILDLIDEQILGIATHRHPGSGCSLTLT